MRGALFLVVAAALFSTASCARSPMLVASVSAVLRAPAATDAIRDSDAGLIEMPPLFVDGRERYRQRIEHASAAAVAFSARELGCPAVRVRRADYYLRADGTPWTVVRVNACGEERVYEQTLGAWRDATARLR